MSGLIIATIIYLLLSLGSYWVSEVYRKMAEKVLDKWIQDEEYTHHQNTGLVARYRSLRFACNLYFLVAVGNGVVAFNYLLKALGV